GGGARQAAQYRRLEASAEEPVIRRRPIRRPPFFGARRASFVSLDYVLIRASYLSNRNMPLPKRNTLQRRHAILALLAEQGEAGVDALARRFATSEVTIRKDLAVLEKNGLLLRRYGGAVPLPQELIAEEAAPAAWPWKQAIALAAVGLILEHAPIISNIGSTHATIHPHLARNARRGVRT